MEDRVALDISTMTLAPIADLDIEPIKQLLEFGKRDIQDHLYLLRGSLWELYDCKNTMHLFFVDDAGQKEPRRLGMGQLVSVGGIIIHGDQARELEGYVDWVLREFGFPKGETFKWSPAKGSWMYDGLKDKVRQAFFCQILDATAATGTKVQVTIEDKSRRVANSASETHEQDVITLALERFQSFLGREKSSGIVIAAQPGGGPKDEKRFLAECLQLRDAGSDYVQFDRLATNVLTSPFVNARLLQVADVVVSCTTALVAGNDKHSLPVFDRIKPLFLAEDGRIGGVGLKLHPLPCFGNLYHWLVGDEYLKRGSSGYPLPMNNWPYASDAMVAT